MTRTRTSARGRPIAIAIVLVIGSGLTPSRLPVYDAPPAVVHLSKLLPAMFPTLAAAGVVTGSDSAICTNSDVNSGNQITITVTRVAGRTTGGEMRTFDSSTRSVNMLGTAGTVAGTFFSGLTVTADKLGTYNRIDVTPGNQLTFLGAAMCVIGTHRRFYYSNGTDTLSTCVSRTAGGGCTVDSSISGSDDGSSGIKTARSQSNYRSTTVTIVSTEGQLAKNYTIADDAATRIDIGFDLGISVYDLGSSLSDSQLVVFPSANSSFAQ